MIKKLFFFFFIFSFFWNVSSSFSNNLRLNNLDVTSIDTSSDKMMVTCDVQQENSWRNNVSHDAIWMFLKYSTDGGQTWRHASMGNAGINPTGFVMGNNFEAVVPQDLKGFFLRRSMPGNGLIDLKKIQFVWNYGIDGISDDIAKASNTILRVFGIEMVYIPQGSFFVGDGDSSSEFKLKKGFDDQSPWYIASENAITTTNTVRDGFYYSSSGSAGESSSGEVFLLSHSFPKGYKGFYLMKYELTEGEWISFFNTLSPAEKMNRDITSAVEGGKGTSAVVNRNTISWDSTEPHLDANTKRSSRAMTYVSWPDAAAFADWAGLRPMTEFEFEKSARGVDVQPIADEFAWGTTAHTVAGPGDIHPVGKDEDGTEVIYNSTANLNRNTSGWTSADGRDDGIASGQKGALRVGIFAESSTNRVTSGAGYYGNMELSGNVAEPVVSIGRVEGRQFLGTHGDGVLSNVLGFEGNATNADWPGINVSDAQRGVTGTKGIGYRGGDFQSSSLRHFQISSRSFSAKDPESLGFKMRFDVSAGIVYGARFVRTAP